MIILGTDSVLAR